MKALLENVEWALKQDSGLAQEQFLQRYQQQRYKDNLLMQSTMDVL